MSISAPAALADLTAPLFERFGAGLTLVREGDRVCWCYSGAAAIVESRCEGAVAATFVSSPIRDAVSATDVRAVYAPRSTYAMTERGVGRMVDDLTAFFSGVREPRFTFVDARIEQQTLR